MDIKCWQKFRQVMSRNNKNAIRCSIARRSLIAAYLFSWAFFRKIFLFGKRCIQVVTSPHQRIIRTNNDLRELSTCGASSLFKGPHLHTMFLNFGIGELFTQKLTRHLALFAEFTFKLASYFSWGIIRRSVRTSASHVRRENRWAAAH